MAAVQEPSTVLDVMILCGIDNATHFNGDTSAEIVAADIFDEDFEFCINTSYNAIDEDFKSWPVDQW